MACLRNQSMIVLAFLLPVFLAACLTPEERAEVYGRKQSVDIDYSTPESAPDSDINGGFAPPKAAPRTPVSTSTIQPLQGLRRSATGTESVTGSYDRQKAQAGDCGASELSFLQGQALASLRSRSFRQLIRIILPGQMITQDHNPKRLNLDITEQGVIGRLWCG